MAKASVAAAPAAGDGTAPPELTRGEATRRRIRQEALDLFYRQGFRATSMREITGACGLTPAAFYNHFGSKDDLLLDIVVDAFASLNAAVEASLRDTDGTATSRLRALVRSMAIWHCANLHQAQVANRETQELDEAGRATVHGHLTQLRSLVEEIIRSGADAGEFALAGEAREVAVRLMSTAVTGFPRSIATSAIEAVGPDALAEMIETLVLRMVDAR
jgi:AcrR family transcriptional regulator